MAAKVDIKALAKRIDKLAKKEKLQLSVIRSSMGKRAVNKLAEDLSSELKGKVVRTGYTPNSDIALFEIRRKGLAVVLLVHRGEGEKVVTVEGTTDLEISEIESNIYASNINDVYVRLVSDIF
jgi:hypothetical protein